MKKYFLAFFGLLMPLFLFAGWENRNITSGGHARTFRLYIPVNYSPSESYSLIIGIHGLGDNMTDFSNYMADFQSIADTARIIIAYPQGMSNAIIGNGWNAGAGAMGIYPSEQYDDKLFIDDIVDNLQAQYPIIPQQTYLFGFSNGGFMTQRIACENNGKFYGFASYAGTIGNKILACNPARKVPLIHFHGTQDVNVGYTSNLFGIGVDSTMKIWENNNGCNGYDIFQVADSKPDGFTVEHYVYKDCNQPVELFKVNDAAHIILQYNQHDISYALETWLFFLRARNFPGLNQPSYAQAKLHLYPIPASDFIKVELPDAFDKSTTFRTEIWDYSGKKMPINLSELQGDGVQTIYTKDFAPGLYILKLNDGKQSYTAKFTVMH